MTIDEAIKHCEEVAEEQDMKAGFETDYQTYTMSETEREKCRECANEHRQLAEWLRELKAWREGKIVQSATDNTETMIFNTDI